jgi:hypothetical protein
MSALFNKVFNDRVSSGRKFYVHGVYVSERKEYILSFEPIYKQIQITTDNSTRPEGVRPSQVNVSLSNAIKDIDGITITFSESKNRWTTSYSYDSEQLQNIPSTYISFWNGRLYKHGVGLPNTFRGQFTPSSITVVFNDNPTIIKFFKNILVESSEVWECPLIENQFGQSSSLIGEDFETFEGVHKASLLQDANTPNIDLPLINGDDIRCHSITVTLQSTTEGEQKLFAAAIRYEPSEMNT